MLHQKFYPNFFLTSALNAHFNFSGGSLETFSMISRHIEVIAYILCVLGTPVPNGNVSVKYYLGCILFNVIRPHRWLRMLMTKQVGDKFG